MKLLTERPRGADAPSQSARRSTWSRWRPAWRLAVREVRHQPARSALVVAIAAMTLPLTAVTLVKVLEISTGGSDPTTSGLTPALSLLIVPMLLGAAFTTSFRYRQRELALLASAGADPGDLARAMIAVGALLGGTGGFLGAIIVVAGPIAESVGSASAGYGASGLDIPRIAAIAVLGAAAVTGLSMLGSWIPARRIARLDLALALRARRPRPVSDSHRLLPAVAAGIAAIGSAAYVLMRPTPWTHPWIPLLATAAVAIGLTNAAARGLAWACSHAPQSLGFMPRAALRDAGRNRLRTTLGLSAIILTSGWATMSLVVQTSWEQYAAQRWSPDWSFLSTPATAPTTELGLQSDRTLDGGSSPDAKPEASGGATTLGELLSELEQQGVRAVLRLPLVVGPISATTACPVPLVGELATMSPAQAADIARTLPPTSGCFARQPVSLYLAPSGASQGLGIPPALTRAGALSIDLNGSVDVCVRLSDPGAQPWASGQQGAGLDTQGCPVVPGHPTVAKIGTTELPPEERTRTFYNPGVILSSDSALSQKILNLPISAFDAPNTSIVWLVDGRLSNLPRLSSPEGQTWTMHTSDWLEAQPEPPMEVSALQAFVSAHKTTLALALASVAATLILTFLSLLDSRDDMAVLRLLGAGTRARRTYAASTAAVLAGLGCLAGAATGLFTSYVYLNGGQNQIDWQRQFITDPEGQFQFLAHYPLAVPWAPIAGIAIAVPLLTIALAWALVRPEGRNRV